MCFVCYICKVGGKFDFSHMTKSSSTEIEAMAACADDEILQIKHTGNVSMTFSWQFYQHAYEMGFSFEKLTKILRNVS